MGKYISHRERMETCLAGGQNDRPPVALWRHFPVDDQAPGALAEAVASFQRTYDFDFIKVTPSSSFCLRDWGVTDEWQGNPEGTREYLKSVVHQPEDWGSLAHLNPHKGFLGQQLECLRLLTKEFSPHTPVLQTIFSPLAQAKHLAARDQLVVHLRRNPDALHAGLETITRSTIAFLEEAAHTGIDGIFYAVQFAQSGILSHKEFEEFGRPYDLQVLEAARSLWFNLVHIHGENILFDQVADYPAQAFNWHDRMTSPGLAEGLLKVKGAVCGGLRQWETLALNDPQSVRLEALDAIQATGGERFILGTGCVIPIITPHGNILAARRSVEE